ncbi:MAG: NAD(P)H-hydrate dehydratase [Nitrospirae bacterium]|nr:MAG: NAD(P)H-hydrate dehydratase [Nitrospirota bacterium]
MELVTAAEMRELDRAAIKGRNIPSLRLMENAGLAVAREMERRFGPLRGKTVTIVAGKGQNGGDGFVVARLLRKRRCQARVALLYAPASLTSDAATNLKKFRKAGGPCHAVDKASALGPVLAPLLRTSDLLVDAVFGTGLNAPVTGLPASAIAQMNASGRPIVAIDLPSGLDGDRGCVLGTAVTAALTVTLARPKRGLYLGVGPDHAGTVRVADIGIPADLIAAAKIPLTLLEAADVRPLIPHRSRTAHKGTFGHAGIIAGSAGKTGAAAMAAMAALRTGAGLVTVATPRSLADVLEAKLLEAMVVAVPETEARTLSKQALEPLLAFAADKTALALGPGIGRHAETQALVHNLLVGAKRPMVLDADGLNAVAGHADLLARASGPLILTPHPGEMARLLGTTSAAIQRDRLGAAARLARERNVCVVLKGAGTIIAAADGRLAVNSTGNPGMATAGTGDVLTGIIVGLLAQGLPPWEAACAGVYLQGLAGDLAAMEQGEAGVIAGDVIRAIPRAIQHVVTGNAPAT